MARLIVTSRFLKKGSAKIKNYVKYIATREGVEVRDQTVTDKNAPATEKQLELIQSLINDFPQAKQYLEYSDFQSTKTIENASELIAVVVERNADVISNRQNFVGYMALRSGVEKRGSHGLFTDSDAPIVLDQVAKEIANHKGNVWSHVVSLRREDAIRLGYDNSDAWRELVKRHVVDIAEQTKISLKNLRWYAAFHDTTHHPHIHLIVYSSDPKQGFLTKQGINKIRSKFANDIFHDELQSLYQEQTVRRDELKQGSREQVKNIVAALKNDSVDNTVLEELVHKLHLQLRQTNGKKVYGYLPKSVKETVDAIFSELAKCPEINFLYEKWCELERQKYKTYTLKEKELPFLTENKSFHSIRNEIIRQVLQIEHTALEQNENSLTRENSVYMTNTVCSLVSSLASCIADDYDQKFFSGRAAVDRKLRQMIRQKKQALGLKSEPKQNQDLEY
ncbi:MAG: MobP3 family relaxase [Oscillospiraceae bacterium]|nr:MobP3 family relaxase [Oscillospiraceae bacterium]